MMRVMAALLLYSSYSSKGSSNFGTSLIHPASVSNLSKNLPSNKLFNPISTRNHQYRTVNGGNGVNGGLRQTTVAVILAKEMFMRKIDEGTNR